MEFQVSNDVSNIVISYSTSSDMSNAVTLATIESATAGTMCLDGEDLFGLSASLSLLIISTYSPQRVRALLSATTSHCRFSITTMLPVRAA